MPPPPPPPSPSGLRARAEPREGAATRALRRSPCFASPVSTIRHQPSACVPPAFQRRPHQPREPRPALSCASVLRFSPERRRPSSNLGPDLTTAGHPTASRPPCGPSPCACLSAPLLTLPQGLPLRAPPAPGTGDSRLCPERRHDHCRRDDRNQRCHHHRCSRDDGRRDHHGSSDNRQ